MFTSVNLNARSSSMSVQSDLLNEMSSIQDAVHLLGSYLAGRLSLKEGVNPSDIFSLPSSLQSSEYNWVDDAPNFSGLKNLIVSINNQQIPDSRNELIIQSLHELINTCESFETAGPCYLIVISDLKCPEVLNHAATQLTRLIQAGQFSVSDDAITMLINLAVHDNHLVRPVANRVLVGLILGGKFEHRRCELMALATQDSAEIVDSMTLHASNRALQKLIPMGAFDQDDLMLLLPMMVPESFPEQTRQVAMQHVSNLICLGNLDHLTKTLQRIAMNLDGSLSNKLQNAAIERISYLSNSPKSK